jgi:hypothetical protein
VCSVTKCPQIFICYPDTTFDRCQSKKDLSFSPTSFGQLETPQFYACLCNRTIIKTLIPSMVLQPTLPVFFCSFLSVLCFASKAVRDKWVISSTDSELGRFASPASSFEQKTGATGSTWAAIAMSLAGFLCRCAILIRPKKEKDYVDPTSLPAPSNNLAAMHTSWCRSGASGCGLFALVYHSFTTPETHSGYRGVRLQSLHCISRALLGRLCSKFCRPGVRVRTYLHHRGVDGVFLTCLTCFIP